MQYKIHTKQRVPQNRAHKRRLTDDRMKRHYIYNKFKKKRKKRSHRCRLTFLSNLFLYFCAENQNGNEVTTE